MNATRTIRLALFGLLCVEVGCLAPNQWGGRPRPGAPEVKAGWADDNAQYNYYLSYLERFAHVPALKVDVSGRIVFTVLDSRGRSMPNCDLTVTAPGAGWLCERKTYADGRAMFFPGEAHGAAPSVLKVRARFGRHVVSKDVDPAGPRAVELRFSVPREPLQQVPLDVAFVLDTTGSMGDEIDKLKATLEAIHFQVTQMTPKPDARFAMVLYRDRKDAYVTRLTPFTRDIDAFDRSLRSASAGGGGDKPEDLQEALRVAARDLKWRPRAVRMVFLLADAPPHLDYGQEFTYAHFMRHAAGAGIKVTAIGASGLDPQGEYVFRQLAQYTMGLFVFLTYGETGESKGATPWTVSHHTGENWESRNLDAIIVQAISRELSHLGETPVRVREDYFQARPAAGVKSEAVLGELFAECARQLVDFSQVRIAPRTPAAVLPATCPPPCPPAVGASLQDHLSLALSRRKSFRLLDREDLKGVLDELKLSRALAFDEKVTAPRGRHVAAKILILSKVRKTAGRYDMFIKLVRVETGEILSATMLKIDPGLVGGG